MDGHSQMVFCAHLSYTADRERGKSENQKEKKEEKGVYWLQKSAHCCLEHTFTVQLYLRLFCTIFSLCLSRLSGSDGAAIVHSAKPDAYWWVQTQHPTDSQAWHPLRSICLPFTKTPSTVCSFSKVAHRREQKREKSDRRLRRARDRNKKNGVQWIWGGKRTLVLAWRDSKWQPAGLSLCCLLFRHL